LAIYRAENSQFLWSEQWQKIAAHQFPLASDERTARIAGSENRPNERLETIDMR
jgi:hypothetical protein